MRVHRLLTLPLLIAAVVVFAAPATAAADTEITGVLGAFIGDELKDVVDVRPDAFERDFDNAPLYGGRIGWSAFPFMLEGSLVVSPSAFGGGGGPQFDVRAIYAEADVFLLLFPGPVSPFVGGGVGLHNFKLQTGTDPTETFTGFNYGGGLKVKFGSLGLRADVRDHVTRLDPNEVDPAFAQLLDLQEEETMHNIELSFGLSISF